MSDKIGHQIPGNIPDGVIRNQHLDLSKLPQRVVANELFECSLTGEASELYGELGPNLISCKLDHAVFPSGVSHFDAKDTLFLHSEIRYKFDRIMVTQCAFRDILFSGSTLRDTAFVDSLFEDVTFADCNFSVTTFKSNTFRSCSFLRCTTSNKLFEHCLFFHCHFLNIALQEGSILQNYGIQLSDTVDLSIYRAETGQPLAIEDMVPKNRLERISLQYFYGFNLNESQDLLEIVQFKLDDATSTNVLHIVSGIRQLTPFILFLYSENKVLLFFPLQLFWSIDQFLGSQGDNELPLNVLEALEVSLARLRRVYEEICLSLPPSDIYHLLIDEEYSENNLKGVIEELQVNVEVKNFRLFNSPSLAEITSPDAFDLLLFVTIVLSTRFRAEVDRYQAERKLLDIGTRLISNGKTNPTAAYQALIALNVPKFLYIRLSARINLSLLSRLRRMILRLLEDQSAYPEDPGSAVRSELPPPITILFLAANPPDTVRLRLDREIKEIDEALRASGVGKRFRIEQAWVVGERELQDSLLRYVPDIVHLSAHGASSGTLLLEKTGLVRDISQESGRRIKNSDEEVVQGLAQVFAIAGQHVRCVVLNACHSAKASEAISPYVGCVIGMSSTILDEAAVRFSWSFYNALAYGKSIKASFDLAIAQLALAGFQQSQVPQLFPGRSDPSALVLVYRDKRWGP